MVGNCELVEALYSGLYAFKFPERRFLYCSSLRVCGYQGLGYGLGFRVCCAGRILGFLYHSTCHEPDCQSR